MSMCKPNLMHVRETSKELIKSLAEQQGVPMVEVVARSLSLYVQQLTPVIEPPKASCNHPTEALMRIVRDNPSPEVIQAVAVLLRHV